MNNNNNKEKEYHSIADKLREGAILKEYGSSYFVSIIPVPGIHKTKFSVVKKGTSGKNEASFYLEMSEMRRFVEEVISGKAAEKFNADIKEAYPKAYQWTAGKDGSLRLAIGGGQKGCRVQISKKENNKWDNTHMSVVPFSAVKDMAFWFNVVMGITPVAYYYDQLAQIFWKGVKEREKFYTSDVENKPAMGSDDPAKQEPADKKASAPSLKVTTVSMIEATENGDYRVQACKTTDQSVITIVITKAAAAEINADVFEKFKNKINTEGASFSFTGKKIRNKETGEECYYFDAFGK